MYKGKHLKHEKRRRWNKSTAMLVSLLLVIGVTVGGTLAYIVAKSDSVENTFTPSVVTTYVEEEIENNVKKDVKIQNTGDTTAYIRAAVVVTWQDEAGNVYGQSPVAGTDYTDWEPGTNWIEGKDGFYYYTKPVAVNKSTDTALIAEIVPISSSPADGYSLAVEIIGSGIQSVPTSVVTTEWSSGVSGVSGDTLVINQQGGAGN